MYWISIQIITIVKIISRVVLINSIFVQNSWFSRLANMFCCVKRGKTRSEATSISSDLVPIFIDRLIFAREICNRRHTPAVGGVNQEQTKGCISIVNLSVPNVSIYLYKKQSNDYLFWTFRGLWKSKVLYSPLYSPISQCSRKREREKFLSTSSSERNGFQWAKNFSINKRREPRAREARARARCKRQAERHKEKKTFRAWNNHDCLWPSSTCPASLARSWSRTILITRWTQTSKPSGSSSTRSSFENAVEQPTWTREINASCI